MDTTGDYHTKWSKSEWERQNPQDITYMWNLKYDLAIRQKQTHWHRKQNCGCHGGGDWGRDGLRVWGK